MSIKKTLGNIVLGVTMIGAGVVAGGYLALAKNHEFAEKREINSLPLTKEYMDLTEREIDIRKSKIREKYDLSDDRLGSYLVITGLLSVIPLLLSGGYLREAGTREDDRADQLSASKKLQTL